MNTSRIILAAAAAASVLALAACAGGGATVDKGEKYTTRTDLNPPPKMVDFLVGPSKAIHMTCSDITGKPVMATTGGGPYGSTFPLPEDDYLRLVAAGEMTADRMYWDPTHPAYGVGC